MPGDAVRSVTLPARPESLDGLHEAVAGLWLDVPDVAVADRLAFETALMEVTGNIVQHACAGLGLDLTVELSVRADRLEAHVQDRGRGSAVRLDEVSLPSGLAESGRGLALAVAVLDELSYRREDGVNHWRLLRRRAAQG